MGQTDSKFVLSGEQHYRKSKPTCTWMDGSSYGRTNGSLRKLLIMYILIIFVYLPK